jgi:hypothetical protein
MVYYYLFVLILFTVFIFHLKKLVNKLNIKLNVLSKEYESQNDQYQIEQTNILKKTMDLLDENNTKYSEKTALELSDQLQKINEKIEIYNNKIKELDKLSYRAAIAFRTIGKIVLIYLVIAIVIYVIFYLSMK